MGHAALVLGDQLSHANPALDGADRVVTIVGYRDQRRRLDLPIEVGGTPSGGRWNFDKDNRRPVGGAGWVMAPNAAGMATWGDGGAMMTKPYAASGNTINRMSRCAWSA